MRTLAELSRVGRSIQLAPEAAATAARQGGIRVVARSPRQHGKGRIPQRLSLSIIVEAGERPRGVERICVHWDSGSPSPGGMLKWERRVASSRCGAIELGRCFGTVDFGRKVKYHELLKSIRIGNR